MAIIVRKISDFLQEASPAIVSWITAKEQGAAGTSDRVVDYARATELVKTGTNLDKAVNYAVRHPGAAGAGDTYAEGGNSLSIAADEHLIGLVVADNLDITDTYLYYGQGTGKNAFNFSEVGVPTLSVLATAFADTVATASGIVAYSIALRRDTNTVEFGHITAAGSSVAVRSVDASSLNGVSFSIPRNLVIWNGALGANPCALYQMCIVKFKGTFKEFADYSEELTNWRLQSSLGTKVYPPFIDNLQV